MAAAYISPLVMEQGYNWSMDLDIKLSNGAARDITTYTAFFTASGLLLTGIVSGLVGRISFAVGSGVTSGYSFTDRDYTVWMFSGVTAEKVAVGKNVLSKAVWS